MHTFALIACALLGLQQPAPSPSPAPAPAAQPKPVQAEKPKPYNESADAKADIAAALARAKEENRRVLIQWGGNWCGWCVKLHQLYKSDRSIATKLLYEYDVVYVDIGHWDKNTDLATQYGADLKTGVPYLTVLDSDGKVVANQETGVLEEKPAVDANGKEKPGGHDPAKVLEFLTKNQAQYLKADELLAAAQARAAQEGKRVFLTFGAPWCPWCHKLEDWMATPQARALLNKDFVLRKIDVDRTEGGKELNKRYGGDQLGLPWFCVLDEHGKSLGDSRNEKGDNVGCPYKDEEIAVFTALLSKVKRNLTPEDIATLRDSLVDMRKRDERKAAEKDPKSS